MFRFFEFKPGVFVRRDAISQIFVGTASSNSHSVYIRADGGQISKTYFTLAEAEAERDRILNEEL